MGLEQTNMRRDLVNVAVPSEVAIVNLLRDNLSHCVTFASIQLTLSRIKENKYLLSSSLGVY